MEKEILSKWDEILSTLIRSYDISPILVTTWIKPLKIQTIKDDTIILSIDKKLGEKGIQFIKNRSFDLYLQQTINYLIEKDYGLDIVVEGQEPSLSKDNNEDPYEYQMRLNESNLYSDYTFDTFVIGENNKHAHAVCTAVAEAPGTEFNPLFLYGGPGLGKTHLIQSVAHYILKNNPSMRVLYVTSEKFTNEIIDALKKHTTEEFRNKYRNVDVLLIDDIQFIIGKESTQQEFFNTFNSLYEEKKQIILTSDKPPKELKTLDERYISRFEWGGPVDIHAPEYETRMAILKNKVERDHLTNIPEEVLQYIAQNIISNIRELEGALKKISIYSRLGNQPITVELAEEVLKDMVSNDNEKEITPEVIIRTVGEHLNISYEDICSSKRSHDIAMARQISMYLCRDLTQKSLQTIASALGGKDHSTVINGVNKIKNLMKEDTTVKNTVEAIKKKIDPS